MQQVYSARDGMEAHLLVSLLEAQGIESRVLGENLQFARGELPLTGQTLPSVHVRDDQVEAAMEIVREFEQNQTDGVVGLPDEPKWRCPGCEEEIEAQFAACWSCQTERPQAL